MERKKYFIIIVSLLIFLNGWASDKEKIYSAYISGNMPEWKGIIDQMQLNPDNSPGFLSELVNYQYGYIGWCVGANKTKEAKHYLGLAEENLKKLEKQNYSPSEINAYKSAFYGFKIGLSPLKAPVLGPKSVNYSKLAMEQDKNNPMGYIQYGNSQFYMPPVFGGSKKVAIEYFEKALELMEGDSLQTRCNWNYLSLLTQIAQSFEAIEDVEKAEFYYQTILEKEPRFVYIKEELYPEFLKENNQND